MSCSQANLSEQSVPDTYKTLNNMTLLLNERPRSGGTPVLQVCGGGHQRDGVSELSPAQEVGAMKQ